MGSDPFFTGALCHSRGQAGVRPACANKFVKGKCELPKVRCGRARAEEPGVVRRTVDSRSDSQRPSRIHAPPRLRRADLRRHRPPQMVPRPGLRSVRTRYPPPRRTRWSSRRPVDPRQGGPRNSGSVETTAARASAARPQNSPSRSELSAAVRGPPIPSSQTQTTSDRGADRSRLQQILVRRAGSCGDQRTANM